MSKTKRIPRLGEVHSDPLKKTMDDDTSPCPFDMAFFSAFMTLPDKFLGGFFIGWKR